MLRSLDTAEVTALQGMALLCMSRPGGDCAIETQSDWGYSLGTTEWKGATGVYCNQQQQQPRHAVQQCASVWAAR